jgi:hypothetical protein
MRKFEMENTSRRLMWHGMFLFLIGLITGFLEQHFANIRMGLAAHLEGVMNGIFLLALGGAWNAVNLRPAIKATAYWTVLYGSYMNWVFTILAAIFGTGAHRRLHERRRRDGLLDSSNFVGSANQVGTNVAIAVRMPNKIF